MAKTLVFRNAKGVEVNLTNKTPFLVSKFDEGTNVNIYSNKGTGQDGSTYLDNTLTEKQVTMELVIIENDEKKAIEHRHTINSVFNPKLGQGTLIYKDDVKTRKIECIVNAIPHFELVHKGGKVQKCLINLTANGAYWFDEKETTNVIATWLAKFEFTAPNGFEFVQGSKGIEFGVRQDTLITNVKNIGGVETGMRIEFTALGTLENPSLFNINTREYIKVNRKLVEGEKVVIDTTFGHKTITSELNNKKTNIFNDLDFMNSKFLQLGVGDNYFRHDATSGLDNLECRIYYSPKYLGI